LEKEGNIEDCVKVHERIHFYLISHEELLFRNDYITNYVHVLITHHEWDRLETVLLKEIWFLKDHLEESKSRMKEMYTWKVALGIIYMISNESEKAALLAEQNKVTNFTSSNFFNKI
jgi:hypothetical protein